jgi:3D (Asp-Asp-Asp) domain-containing protein/peptidoglycan/xylan/chitin deacetylase (PgdA/CDA1 family)
MYKMYIGLRNLERVTIYSIIIVVLLTPIVFCSAAHLNHSYALQQDTKTTAVVKYHSSSHPSYGKSTACNCVVFRMDDLQDYWISTAQITAMNLFLSKHIPLSLAIIMNSIGNDSQVVDKIREGSKAPNALFELAVHGWNHVNYADLSKKEQADTLNKANDKMLQLFGNKSDIFVTPYGPFNADTIEAMNNAGIQILSSALVNEARFDGNASIAHASGFPGSISSPHHLVSNNNNMDTTTNDTAAANSMIVSNGQSHIQNHRQDIVYHLPAMSLYYDDENGKTPIKTPIAQILVETKNNIKKYGYSVIVFHPQDLVERDGKGNVIDNGVNQSEVNDLSYLIDSVVKERIPIVHFSTLVKYININNDHNNNSTQHPIGSYSNVGRFGYFQNPSSGASDNLTVNGSYSNVERFGHFQNPSSGASALQNCSSGWYVTGYSTPVESDYNGSKQIVKVISLNSGVKERAFYNSFLRVVEVEGWGKTLEGDYVGFQTTDKQWHSSPYPVDSKDQPIQQGTVAVDPTIIKISQRLIIPTLPPPWDNRTLTANDVGPDIKGKHIDVYTGEGKNAKEETFRITNHDNVLCLR